MSVKSFFGGLFIAIGFIVILISGGCAILIGIKLLSLSGIVMAVSYCGIPLLLGYMIMNLGKSMTSDNTSEYSPENEPKEPEQ